MEIYIHITFYTLFLALLGYCIYSNFKLKLRLKEQDISHKKSLSEAGAALTNTLKIAFDNIKQLNQKVNKLNTDTKENKDKIRSIMAGNKISDRKRMEMFMQNSNPQTSATDVVSEKE